MVGTVRHERNTDGLLAHARRRSQETRQRVSDTIDRLIRDGEEITFNSVAAAAGVSKNYLYEHTDLRNRIDAIRLLQGQERQHRIVIAQKQNCRTENSKDVLLAVRERRIQQLELDIRHLKDEVKVLHGKLYDRL